MGGPDGGVRASLPTGLSSSAHRAIWREVSNEQEIRTCDPTGDRACWAAVLFSGCETVAEMGSQVAREAGVISSSQADSITRGAKAVGKTWQDLTPEQEYYIGRAVAAQVFQTYRLWIGLRRMTI